MEKMQFFVPLVQGYFGSIVFKKFQFYLISRRSFMMGGTRYNSRGIDSNGFVANFVETEQLLAIEDSVYTHI